MDDIRKSPRISPLSIPARFQLGEESKHGYLTNMSETGAFLATEVELSIDQMVEVQIDLPWELGQVTAEARVVWKTQKSDSQAYLSGAGLAFEFLTLEGIERIRDYMEKCFHLVSTINDENMDSISAE